MVGGTYDRDGNSVPYLAATPDMEIQLGQISLTDFNRLAVRATITEREDEEAGFYFYLDSETNPLIVARPAETAGNAVSEDVQADFPATEGVHAVRMVSRGQKADVYAVTLSRQEKGDGIPAGKVRKPVTDRVDVYGLNGTLIRSVPRPLTRLTVWRMACIWLTG